MLVMRTVEHRLQMRHDEQTQTLPSDAAELKKNPKLSDVADVIVTGVITDGVARSLNQQKNADGTVNVLSADAIGRYPDPNVAESLQRVQGIAIQRDADIGTFVTKQVQTRPHVRDTFTVITFSPFLPSKK